MQQRVIFWSPVSWKFPSWLACSISNITPFLFTSAESSQKALAVWPEGFLINRHIDRSSCIHITPATQPVL
ncbi:hypothetical protein PGT21_018564 [Puccinia graminis f. sp. tritici]|nr:hypothetical protein PGT21_018564 [Puccinia graminis f. sp. tritici]